MKINLLSIQEKKVNARSTKHTSINSKSSRSTKHQVHFGINRGISILISTLVDIMFLIFKNDRGILDFNKMQPRPKMFCVSSSRYLCLIYSL